MQVGSLLTPQPNLEVNTMSHESLNSGDCLSIGQMRNTAPDRHVLSVMLPNTAGHSQIPRARQQASEAKLPDVQQS